MADAAEAMRQRLQTDLRSAMKQRALSDVAILRVLIAAIDNAGAMPMPPKYVVTGEVERLRLDAGDVQAILGREYEALRVAADEFVRLGRPIEANQASCKMLVARRYTNLGPG